MIDLAPIPVPYTPHGGARTLFATRAPEVLIEGPAGTGKTRACLERVVYLAGKYPNSRHLLVRKTRTSMSESVLVTMEADVLVHQLDSVKGNAQRSHRQHYHLDNGSTIVIGGMDNADRLMSSQYDTITAFEATELTEDDWEKLLTRLRNNVMPYQQGLADCNPSAPTHWLNQRASTGRMQRVLSRHDDNPTVTPAYLERLGSLTGVRRSRLFEGKWASAEGVVYDGFDAAVHVIDAMPTGWEAWPKYRCIDFGFTNPFVCQWWAMDPDGRLYLYREIYRTQRTVRDHAQQIKALSQGENIRETITDHDAEDRATLRQEGIESVGAKKDIRPGLDAVALRLRPAGDGRPRIQFLRNALAERDGLLSERKAPLCTADEFDCYLWRKARDGTTIKEEPDKVNDHGMDAMRYMVMHIDGGDVASIGFVDHSDHTPVLTPEEVMQPKPIDIEAETNRMLAGMFGGRA